MSGVKIDIGPTGRRVAGNIESTRRAAKLSLIEMSKRLNEIARPLSANSLAGIEAGERRVDVEDLLCIADVLGVTVARLLGDESVREDEPARPVEDREPGMPMYPPFGQSGVPLVDDNGAPFSEETQQLFREVAQDAYLRGIRDQRDREPVGPYAPTLTGPTIDRDGNIAYPNPVGEAAEAINGKINALTDVMGERFGRIDTALTKLTDLFVDSRDEIERIKASAECTIGHSSEPVQMVQFKEAFERGRQQGDADRAQRGQTEFERGVRVGQTKREAELLDQGWTPPGAIGEPLGPSWGNPTTIVHELDTSTGPTDYEVWRDALTLSATNVFPIGGTGEASTFDDDRRAQILADAEFFRHHLINHPTISPAEADQAIDDQIDAITEHEAAADLPAKETPGAEADYPF